MMTKDMELVDYLLNYRGVHGHPPSVAAMSHGLKFTKDEVRNILLGLMQNGILIGSPDNVTGGDRLRLSDEKVGRICYREQPEQAYSVVIK